MIPRCLTWLGFRLLKLAGWETVEVMREDRAVKPMTVTVLRERWCRCAECRGE